MTLEKMILDFHIVSGIKHDNKYYLSGFCVIFDTCDNSDTDSRFNFLSILY